MSRIIDRIKESLYETPHIYSDDELISLGIDPNLFVFISRPDFSDNSFALWEYITHNTKYKTAWLLLKKEHCEKLTKQGIVNAVHNTPEGRKLARSAKIYICNTDISYVCKYPGQIFVNLWHGSGVKALDFISYKEDNLRLKIIKRTVDEFDLSLVHSHVDKINMAAEYSCDARRFIATGQPRLDRVKSAAGKENILKLFGGGLGAYDKLILYTPTHRITGACKDGDFFSSNVFNMNDYNEQKLCAILERFNAALVTKLHPIDGNKFNPSDLHLGKHCYLLNDEILFFAELQMNDILNAFDVMIADYSSIITDYLLLDRPVVYSIGDFDKYSQNKGFVYNDVSFYMPGEKATNFADLLAFLEDAFTYPNRHSQWRRDVYRQKSSFMDDKSCERALKAIENYKPLTNYEKNFFIETTLLPVATQYEEKLNSQQERLEDYEERISSAIEIIEKNPLQNSVMKTVLSVLSTSTVSLAEQHAQKVKKKVESICDEILESYLGEYVFFSLPQKHNWTGKTRTMLHQVAEQTAKMGHLFLVGETKDMPFKELVTIFDFPSARKLSDKLIILDYCHYTEIVLKSILRHGKKAIFVIPSDLFTFDRKVIELSNALAYKTIYLYRYHIKDYLGQKSYNEVDILRWDTLNYACRNEKVHIIAATEFLYNLLKEEAEHKNIILQTPGVDYAMFAKNGNTVNIPEKLKAIKDIGNPIFGYCGTMDTRLYFSVIHYICAKRTNYQFVFVGSNRIKSTWGHVFEDYPNIHLLEEVDYECIPGIIKVFDAAIIPYFKSNGKREPAKLFEYFACEKPVIITDMEIGEKYGNIFMGASHGDFVNALDMALAAKDDETMKKASASIARENDWKCKAEEILRWIGV